MARCRLFRTWLVIACAFVPFAAAAEIPALEVIKSLHQALKERRFNDIDQAVAQALAEQPTNPGLKSREPFLLSAFKMSDPELEDLLNDWVTTSPESYAARAMRGSYRITMAWAWRGHAFVKDTHPERFKHMHRYLAGAESDLEVATHLAPGVGFAYAQLITLAKLAGRNELARQVLDRAMKSAPDSVAPWRAYAEMLVPRWGGSHEEMEAFAKFAEARKSANFEALAKEIRHEIIADRANTAEHEKDRATALRGYQEANALVELPGTLCQTSALYRKLGQIENADAAARKALAVNPNNTSCLVAHALTSIDLRRPAIALANLRDAAFLGDMYSAKTLGVALFDGNYGFPIDMKEGIYWLERAAYFWDKEALYQLGAIFERGEGVKADPVMAAHHYRYCANLGDARCETNLGMMLWYGKGIPANQDEAMRLWHRVAKKGVWQGGHNLNYFLSPTQRLRVVFTLGPGMWAKDILATLAAILVGTLLIFWIVLRRRTLIRTSH